MINGAKKGNQKAINDKKNDSERSAYPPCGQSLSLTIAHFAPNLAEVCRIDCLVGVLMALASKMCMRMRKNTAPVVGILLVAYTCTAALRLSPALRCIWVALRYI